MQSDTVFFIFGFQICMSATVGVSIGPVVEIFVAVPNLSVHSKILGITSVIGIRQEQKIIVKRFSSRAQHFNHREI